MRASLNRSERPVAGWMARRPVVSFYILAFGITWGAWVPQTAHARGVSLFGAAWIGSPVLYAVGGLGPGIAAVVVMRVLWGGPDGDQRLKAAVLRWRVGARWLAVALLAYVGIWLAALGLAGGWSRGLLDAAAWLGLVPGLLLYVVLAVPEEVGWRGFAQVHLQTRYSALRSALIVGGLWSLWHLPLRLNPDEVAEGSSQLAWVVATIAAAVLYAWLFNSTGGSVLMVIVLHAVANTMSPFIGDMAGDVAGPQAAVVAVLAAVLVVAFGSRNLARRPRPTAPTRGTPAADPSTSRIEPVEVRS